MGFASLKIKLLDKEDEDCGLQTLFWKSKFELLVIDQNRKKIS